MLLIVSSEEDDSNHVRTIKPPGFIPLQCYSESALDPCHPGAVDLHFV